MALRWYEIGCVVDGLKLWCCDRVPKEMLCLIATPYSETTGFEATWFSFVPMRVSFAQENKQPTNFIFLFII